MKRNGWWKEQLMNLGEEKRIFKRTGWWKENLLFPQAYSRADLDKNPKLLKQFGSSAGY